MAVSEAQKKAQAKYDKNTYDKFMLKMRKDADLTLDNVREHAALYDKSINNFIIRAIKTTMTLDRDRDGYRC